MKKSAKKKGASAGKITAVGIGMAAVGAGMYYFLGPKGKQNQKKAVKWMSEIEKEVEKKLKKATRVSEPVFHKIVDTIAATYKKKYKENSKEIDALAKKIKGEWKKMQPKKVTPKKKKPAGKSKKKRK